MERIIEIIKFALIGAIWFGSGGVVLGYFMREGAENPMVAFFAMVFFGAIGGAALGLVLKRRVMALAIAGTIGFTAGGLLGVLGMVLGLLPPTDWEAGLSEILESVPLSVLIGISLGVALGLALQERWKAMGYLVVAGVLGGVIGSLITGNMPLHTMPLNWLLLGLQGVIGGAFMGVALGLLEMKAQRNTTSLPDSPTKLTSGKRK